MAQSNVNKTEMKQQLDKTDEKLRHKYLEVVKSLELDELKHFNKMRYKVMAITDFTEQHPDADKNDIYLLILPHALADILGRLIAMLSVYVIIWTVKPKVWNLPKYKSKHADLFEKMHRRGQNPPLKTTADPRPSGLVTDHKLQIIT